MHSVFLDVASICSYSVRIVVGVENAETLRNLCSPRVRTVAC